MSGMFVECSMSNIETNNCHHKVTFKTQDIGSDSMEDVGQDAKRLKAGHVEMTAYRSSCTMSP